MGWNILPSVEAAAADEADGNLWRSFIIIILFKVSSLARVAGGGLPPPEISPSLPLIIVKLDEALLTYA